eukprot:TRINITY_DN5443_c0_g1_i5.p1 TRINITY_DN5443_c0_g1~~TRINITY_DN5443_c0_g1_i5.p1  ORF type:complete len:297 (+),score=46.53 TRINITY_DN5443_c0_g1_i5:56-946(+)
MTDVFIGFEGGGTHTSVTLIDRDGNILCEMDDAPCSNIWEIGMDACAQLIVEQVNRAKSLANLSSGTTLRGIGVSLSGLETIRSQQQLVAAVIEKDKSMKETVLVSCNDVQCATQCGIPQGGVLLIAGTGSNCQVSNPSCGSAKFGGWGYMIGDQGSAYYIVHQLIQKTIHLCEGLSDSRFPQHDVDDVKTRLLKYFNITSLDGLLEVYYKDFNRARISGFCVDVANGAESGNTLCKWIFDKAARYLAKHIEAVYPNIQKVSIRDGMKKHTLSFHHSSKNHVDRALITAQNSFDTF